MTTKRGINIGSLFIIDDRVRPKLTASQIDFLGTVAGIVMRNLELNHEAEERDRSLRMSGALNAFQESRSIIHNPNLKKRTSFDNGDLTSKKRRAKADSIDILVGSVSMGPDGSYGYRDINPLSSNVITPRSSKPSEPASETGDPGFDQPNDIPQQDGDQTPASSFVRAASLLRQSLDLQDTGGVVFLDSRIGFNGQEAEKYLSSIAEDNQSVSSLDTISTAYNGSGHRVTSRKHKHALDVIGFSTAECELGSQVDMGKVGSFSPVDPATLQSFFDHYPRGKLWCFDEGGVLSAWDEDSYDGDPRVSSRETAFMRHQRKQTEATLLSRCFPNGKPPSIRSHYELFDPSLSTSALIRPRLGFQCWSVVFRVFLFFIVSAPDILCGSRAQFPFDVLQHGNGRVQPDRVYGRGASEGGFHRQYFP